MTYRPRRSVLFMPASNLRALEKAKSLSADSIVFDLEDSVGPEEKHIARVQACDAVQRGDYGFRELVIRVNGVSTEWFQDDLHAAIEAGADAVLVPKIDDGDDIDTVSQFMDDAGAPGEMELWVMIETPRGVLYAGEIAEASMDDGSRLSCMVMGTNDLAKATGTAIVEDRWTMMNWLQHCVLAAKSYGLCILDAVYNDYKNEAGFHKECIQGKAMGMHGKTLIHPLQIQCANDVFAPSDEEIRWSRKILEAFDLPENADKGVISLDGKMVERLHADIAEQVVEVADAIERMR